MALSKTQLPEFTGKNFQTWRQRAKEFFTQRKLWKALTGGNPRANGRAKFTRWARPEATTARFGHDSAAAGQGTKGRDKRWLRGPRLLQPGKRPGWRGGGLLSCAAVSSTNLLVSEAGRKFYFGSQASLPESKRSALAVSLFLFDPPTHPGNRCSGEQGGVAVAASSSGAGSGGLQGTRAGASVREQAQSALIRC